MLSRVAENLYWISRYVERAEKVVRLLTDAFQLELELGGSASRPRPIENVLSILNCQDALRDRGNASPMDSMEEMLRFLTFERSEHVSILDMIVRARESARGVQEVLSTEAWSQLNHLYLFLNSPKAQKRFESGVFRFFQRVKRECMLFVSIIEGSLPRTEAFHFLRVGRQLERIDMLARIIHSHCLTLDPNEIAGADGVGHRLMHWTALLRSASAHESYLRHSREHIDPPGVIRYLLLEVDFPRSMRFSVVRCLESLRAIAGSSAGSNAERHLGRLEGDLRYMDIDEVLHRGISPFLIGVQEICTAVGNEIEHAYFRT